MKIFKRIFAALASLALVAMPVITSGSVGAVTITSDPENSSETWPTELTITREVEGVTNPVVNTYTYRVSAADTNPAPVTNLPADFTISFDGSETIVGNKVSKSVQLDMSGINFTKVGDYDFIIKEISSSKVGIYPIDVTEWYAYVSVRYVTEDHTTGGTPTAVIEATLAPQAKAGNTGAKTDIVFNSSAEFTHISVSEDVTGNLADISEYFPVTIDFVNDDVAEGTQLIILGDHSVDGSTTVSSSTATVTGGSFSFYLKHSQNVTIGLTDTSASGLEQLPVGVEYEISTTASGYRIFVDGATSAVNDTVTVEKTTVSTASDNATSFVSNKEADPITGFFVNYWPFMLLIALGATGLYAIKKTAKKN